ncbi:D-alanyl-D-alanine carboxypeptidase [Candidatus Falkowbacteria bacterium]|nr:D-alanyl-D-alanine carboxypeptidase [Candidatus Falkowbacteria bacterium]
MLANILLSLFIIPALGANYFNFDGFLNLHNNQAVLEQQAPKRIYTDYLDIKITAQSAIAVDVKSGKILYKKNIEEIRPIASITKLMTALVFLDHNPGWQNEIKIKAEDRNSGGIIYLNIGDTLTLKNLFYTALVVSDNDAADALMRASGLNSEQFISEMNVKAKSLNLNNTQFVDPTGLHLGNKSNIQDIVRLLYCALQNEAIQKATSMAKYEFEVKYMINDIEKTRTVKLRNTDWLLGSYLNVVGGKTGHLEEAGYCFATKILGEQNQEIIVVVLGSDSNFNRFQDVKAITDWVFNNYQW